MPITRLRSSGSGLAKRSASTSPTTVLISPKTRTTRTSFKAKNAQPQADGESTTMGDKNTSTINTDDPAGLQIKLGQKNIRKKSNSSVSKTAKINHTRKSREAVINTIEPKSSSNDLEDGSPDATSLSQASFADSEIESLSRHEGEAETTEKSATTVDGSKPQSRSAEKEVAETDDDANAKLAAREKLRVANDRLVRKLYRSLPANFKKAENLALDFVVEQIHHPVISCFRELMNLNDLTAFFRPNGKKRLRSFEFGLIGLGMLDSMAMTLYNPLYQESFDCLWNRKISQKVENILQKLRPLLTSWGSSEKSSDQEHYDAVMKYLHHLTPHFQPINFSETFESALANITESVTHIIKTRQDLRLKTQSFFNSKDVGFKPTNSDPSSNVSTPTSSRTIAFSLSVELPTSVPTSDGENDWKMPTFSSESPSPQKKAKILFPSSTSNASEPDDVIIINLASKFLEEEEPAAKRQKLDPDNSSNLREKPKVNAFALMMNRSRQLAEEAKMKQDKIRAVGNKLEVNKCKSKPKAIVTL